MVIKNWNSANVRKAFLDFFAQNGHQIVESSSLVPGTDPTLLFTNAGMVQFKDVFLGLDKRPYRRAATAQKCMRISGKHNDLENVGPSPRHHTFFEMLGNFSFGDYFKSEAIRFAYDLLTTTYSIPVDRLRFTVYQDDDAAYEIWAREVGVPKESIYRMGAKTNFWQMAETGPCGPTSEIHYDWGKDDCTCHHPECSVLLDNGCQRWLEIWNLVFMQFNRTQPDPSHSGKFDEPLPAPGVDTGMGLERILAILQNAKANYDTDLFIDIMDATQEILGHDNEFRGQHSVAYRVIADHIRAASFLIADGVNPGTNGREYIVRMLIRRAWRFAHSMEIDRPFLTKVAEVLIAKMRSIYPELEQFKEAIQYQISAEEERFISTIDNAMSILNDIVQRLRNQNETIVSGEDAFFLYATWGLPLEITRDLVAENGMTVNEQDFLLALQEHRRKAETEAAQIAGPDSLLQALKELDFSKLEYDPYNYEQLSLHTKIVAILHNGQRVEQAHKDEQVELVLERTPFYSESGGQISDIGYITGKNGRLAVSGMRKPTGNLFVHSGTIVQGILKQGDTVNAAVDVERRWDTMRNHTATHLLHASLRKNLGEHVRQKGSLVAPDKLRFDFTHNMPLTQEELDHVTADMNRMILADRPVAIVEKSLSEARQEGAMALFGEKYGQVVRTVTIPELDGKRFSYELCGGTHVERTSQIGNCIILNEESSGGGVRRIVAITGHSALAYLQQQLNLIQSISINLGVAPDAIERSITSILQEEKELRAQLAEYSANSMHKRLDELLTQTQQVQGISLLAAVVDAPDIEMLGQLADWARDRLESCVIALGSEIEGSARLVVKISPDLVSRGLHAGKLVSSMAKYVDGNGGGRPDFATAGGKKPAELPQALQQAHEFLANTLK
jgi:alanyl-tRNA synthetase